MSIPLEELRSPARLLTVPVATYHWTGHLGEAPDLSIECPSDKMEALALKHGLGLLPTDLAALANDERLLTSAGVTRDWAERRLHDVADGLLEEHGRLFAMIEDPEAAGERLRTDVGARLPLALRPVVSQEFWLSDDSRDAVIVTLAQQHIDQLVPAELAEQLTDIQRLSTNGAWQSTAARRLEQRLTEWLPAGPAEWTGQHEFLADADARQAAVIDLFQAGADRLLPATADRFLLHDALFTSAQARGVAVAGLLFDQAVDWLPAQVTELLEHHDLSDAAGRRRTVGALLQTEAGRLALLGESSWDRAKDWGVSLGSAWLDNSLRLDIAYGVTAVDEQALHLWAEDPTTDTGASAVEALLRLSSEGELEAGWIDHWSGELRYQASGDGLLDPPSLADGSGLFSMALAMGWTGMTGQLARTEREAATGRENYDAPSLQQSTGLDLAYTPTEGAPAFALWKAFGTPSVSAHGRRTRHLQKSSGTGEPVVAKRTDVARTAVQITRPRWNWVAHYQLTQEESFADTRVASGHLLGRTLDTRREMSGLKLSLTPNTQASFDVALLWNTVDGPTTDDERQRYYSVTARIDAIPEKLSLNMNYRRGLGVKGISDTTWRPEDFTADSAFIELSWHALETGRDEPTVDLYLRGEYGRQHNQDESQFDQQWSARLGVKLLLPGGAHR